MLSNPKHVFWEALLITIFIFGIGILLGVFIENSRESKINQLYLVSELNLLDVKIQTEILNLKDLDCDSAIVKNTEFADRVYEEAKLLEKYEEASGFKDDIEQYHKRYDLLRTLLWLNSLKIKEKCGANSFHTLVYLYDYKSEDSEQKAKQEVFSRFLGEMKSKYNESVILVPIARNLDISSLDLMTRKYGINATSIILDENFTVYTVDDLKFIDEKLSD